MSGSISPDGRYIYFHKDQHGNEIGHLVRVPFEGGELQDLTPILPPYSSNAWSINRTSNQLALNIVTRNGFDLYLINLKSPDESRRVWHSNRFAAGPVISADGKWIICHSTERTGKMRYSLLALNAESDQVARELFDGSEYSTIAACFSPIAGDMRVLARTNRTGVNRPLIWNLMTGERSDLPIELEGDVQPLDWSDDAMSLLLCQSNKATQQLYRYDLSSAKLVQLNHPPSAFGQWSIAYFAGNEIFAHREDSTHPLRVTALDGESGVETRVVLATDAISAGHAWQSIKFTSSDGVSIQGWLGLPTEHVHSPLPTILHLHGGPFTVQTNSFLPTSQAWLEHGFAFLSINYRGSTTFGREFQDKILGNPGQWEIDDIVAACDWLVRQGIAKPKQILLIGGSYGGYLTLLALGKHPDLWAGGIAQRAIADWSVCYEDEKDTHRGMQVALFGGTPQETPEQHAHSSPMTYIEQIVAPMLIIQGRNDTRTPARQMENFVSRARSLGKSIEEHWYEAGHLEIPIEQEISHMELMLRFASKVLSHSL
jgi:dipeptidyl aminopeptidase/acylaminoacyl peptidase